MAPAHVIAREVGLNAKRNLYLGFATVLYLSSDPRSLSTFIGNLGRIQKMAPVSSTALCSRCPKSRTVDLRLCAVESQGTCY
jgi:hypothetical protein